VKTTKHKERSNWEGAEETHSNLQTRKETQRPRSRKGAWRKRIMLGANVRRADGVVVGGDRGGGSSSSGAKRQGKLRIQLRKEKPRLPEGFLETSWTQLRAAVEAIQGQRPVTHSREELYHMVEGLCMHKRAPELCRLLEQALQAHIAISIKGLADRTPDAVAFLGIVTNTWLDFCQQMQSIRSIFLYLDRSYILNEPSLRSIWDMGLAMFRSNLALVDGVQDKIIRGFLELISQERKGESISQSTCSSLVRMLVSLSLYESHFEGIFLEETSIFYREESSIVLQECGVAEYLLYVEKRLSEERQRVIRYLDPQTRLPLIRTCEQELIGSHIDVVLEKGFNDLLDTGRLEDIGRMYMAFSRVKELKKMKKALYSYSESKGLQIIKDESKEKEMVNSLLDLKQKLDNVWIEAMDKNPDFEGAIKGAFQKFMNSRESKPAELLAKSIDRQLRNGGRGVGGEGEVETLLERVVVLFRFLHAKDVFEAFYKKDLAKRLLLGRSSSTDLERLMIGKLKTECGQQFTNRLEGMFKDIRISKDLMNAFEKSDLYKKRGFGTEMSVSVLSTSNWPAKPPMKSLEPPDIMRKCQSLYEEFYCGSNGKFDGRRLSWQHSLGHCIVGANLPQGRKELEVSMFQAMVLLCLDQAPYVDNGTGMPSITVAQAQDLTGIEQGELERTLLSLSSPSARLLVKEPRGAKDIKPEHTFTLNANFKSERFRIKINSIQIKETSKENKETHERVQQVRQYQIDAAIVRIMKARKTLTHQLLLAECFKQLQFNVKAPDLKRRIESLIDREYLERDESDPNTYKYLA